MSKRKTFTPEELKAMYDELAANQDKAQEMYAIAFARDFISKEIDKEISVEKAKEICDEIISTGERVYVGSLMEYIKAGKI